MATSSAPKTAKPARMPAPRSMLRVLSARMTVGAGAGEVVDRGDRHVHQQHREGDAVRIAAPAADDEDQQAMPKP
jgi:hypothetical protein